MGGEELEVMEIGDALKEDLDFHISLFILVKTNQQQTTTIESK